jgi:hypothetical protein
MERLNQMRKKLCNCILLEDENNDSRDSKSRGIVVSVRLSKNEGNFKNTGHTTLHKNDRGGKNSGRSSRSLQNISAMQPLSQSSHDINQKRMKKILLGLVDKP